jgi:hypothetical protein
MNVPRVAILLQVYNPSTAHKEYLFNIVDDYGILVSLILFVVFVAAKASIKNLKLWLLCCGGLIVLYSLAIVVDMPEGTLNVYAISGTVAEQVVKASFGFGIGLLLKPTIKKALRHDNLANPAAVSVGEVLATNKSNTISSTTQSAFWQRYIEIEDELMLANLNGDWQKTQNASLQRTWLNTLLKVEYPNTIPNRSNPYPKLDESLIRFPLKWTFDSFYHFPFCQEIVSDFGKVLADNGRPLYKPNKLLPYPKHFIQKAMAFTLDYLDNPNPLYEFPSKDKVRDELQGARVFLNRYFINTDGADLPQDDMENYRVGKAYLDKQSQDTEKNSLTLIDWYDCKTWTDKGFGFIASKQFELAIYCYERTLELNPVDPSIVHAMLEQLKELNKHTSIGSTIRD